MKKTNNLWSFVFSVAAVLIFNCLLFMPGQTFADHDHRGQNGGIKWQNKHHHKYRQQERDMRHNHHHHSYQKHDHHHHKAPPALHRHRGYRNRPYGKHRHYIHHNFKGNRYVYRGHWRSWVQWDRYARMYPHIYKHGRYYHDNNHLMFRYCEPATGNHFFFSIGR